MSLIFYITAIIAVFSTLMVVTRVNIVHALLYLIVSLLAVAVIFFMIGAPFIAALEVIIYAGAIMVLFLFVIMILNLGEVSVMQEKQWLNPGIWIVPGLLSFILLILLLLVIKSGEQQLSGISVLTPAAVGTALFSSYILAVEIAAFLLLAGIVGASHLGKRTRKTYHRFIGESFK